MIKITSLHPARGDSARISQDFNDVLWSERKKYFYTKYLGQSQTTPSIIHYSELCDSQCGGEMSTKININKSKRSQFIRSGTPLLNSTATKQCNAIFA